MWRSLALIAAALACLGAASGHGWDLPGGRKPPPVPAANPMNAAKVELGRRLFYDADLSINGTMSCATCHEQKHAFTDTNRSHPGVHGDPARRNVMALANVGYFTALTWGDRRLATLEAQVAVPVLGAHPVEMGMAGQEAELVRRLAASPCYRRQFAASFPKAKGEISMAAVSQALAAFERTLVSFDSPYDRQEPMSVEARRGEALFRGRRLACANCHAGPLFTDADRRRAGFHDIGLPRRPADLGLSEVTGKAADQSRFRTPSLRNAELTAPYLHDGSAPTLAEAIGAHAGARRAGITEGETADLVAFLATLTDRTFVADPRFSLPKACRD